MFLFSPEDCLLVYSTKSLLSIDWNSNTILRVGCTGPASMEATLPPSKEWCVNSATIQALLSDAMVGKS